MKKRRLFLWKASCLGMIVLSLISLSPLVIPPSKSLPMFLGLPYSLWTGMLISLAMIILTVIAAIIITYKAQDKEL